VDRGNGFGAGLDLQAALARDALVRPTSSTRSSDLDLEGNVCCDSRRAVLSGAERLDRRAADNL
jgi:hypothetical protein